MDIYGFLLLLFCAVLAVHLLQRKKLNLPPSPRGLPLIGHLHLLGTTPHKSLLQLARQHGPLMFLKLGMVPAIIVSNANMAREVLKTEDLTFSSRPYMLVGEYLMYDHKSLGTIPYGEPYKKLRKLSVVDFFSPARLRTFTWMYREELRFMFDTLINSHEQKKAVNLRSVFYTFTFNSMTQMLSSKRYFTSDSDDEDKEARDFKEIFTEAVAFVIGFHVSEFFPDFLRWIGKSMDWSIPRARILRVKLDRFMQKILDEHKNTQRECKDITDSLLEEYGSDEETIKGTILAILMAGTDSSAIGSEWALAELIHKPHIMEKARKELDSVVGPSRMVNESDFPKLEYLQAVVKEMLRLHGPAALLIPRSSDHACKVAGYDVPKGSTLIVNAYAMARDESVWENPELFMPERFIGSSVDVKGQNFELIPFGAGRRICPGVSIGLKTVQLVVANLIHGFDWSLAAGKTHSLDAVFKSVYELKTPLEAVAVPRLAPEVYANLK